MPKISTINTTPLQLAVKKVHEHRADIAQSTARYNELTAEVKQLTETMNPNNEEMVRMVALRKVQADMLPTFIDKAKERGPALVNSLVAEIKEIEAALEEAVKKNEEDYADDLGKGVSALRVNFCPGVPRDINSGAITRNLSGNFMRLEMMHPNSNHPDLWKNFTDAALARATELIEIAADFQFYERGTAKRKIAEMFGLKVA